MKKHYFITTISACVFAATMSIAQCTSSISTTASTVCSGGNVTLNVNAIGPANNLTTTFAGGNNHRGNMFDISATNTVIITSFDAHPMGNTTIAIYYKTGTWVGFANTPGAWTLVGSAAVTAQPFGTPTPVPVPVNVTIPAGQTYAFYVTSTNTAVSLNYTDGSSVGNILTSDANIAFHEGAGLEYPFSGSPFTPRDWNGIIHYAVAGASTTYLWNTTATTQSINPVVTNSTMYSCTVNTTGCPTMNPSINIAVSVPPVDGGVDQTVCAGTPVILSGSGAVSYSWDNGVSNGIPFSPASSLSYIVTGTDSIGCMNNDTVLVNVNNLPNVNAGPDQSVCAGTAAILSGSNAVFYSWDNGVMNGVAFAPSTTQNYIVTGTDGNGCMNTDTVMVSVNPLPTVNGGTDLTVCSGSQVTLTASGANSYLWDNGVSDGIPFSASSSASYIVSGTDGNGCMNTDTVLVFVNPLPIVHAGPDQTICDGSQVTLSGSGAPALSWDNFAIDGVPFTPLFTANYILTGTDINGCVNTDTVLVTLNPLPNVSAGADQNICSGSSVTLSGSGASTYSWDNGVSNGLPFSPTLSLSYIVVGTDVNGCANSDTVLVIINSINTATTFVNETITATQSGASYQWINCSNNQAIAGATSQSYTAIANGNYAVIVTQNGCSDTSACQTISSVGIDEYAANGISVYPNPTDGLVTLSIGNSVVNEVSVIDAFGRTIETVKQVNQTLNIDLQSYANGLYFIRISSPDSVRMIKVIKK